MQNKFFTGQLKFKQIGICLFSFLMVGCGLLEGDKTNIKQEGFIYITRTAKFDEVLDSIRPFLIEEESFVTYAKVKDYPSLIKAGKYKIVNGESNQDVIQRLRAGIREEVKVRIKNEPTIFHLAGSVSKAIEADSTEIVESILNWKPESSEGLNAETVKQFFIPNTYNFYWETSADTFVKKMYKEYNQFWTNERKSQAQNMNFTPLDITILASITQMEAPKSDEQARVARAYLNRLKIGKKLEADPTSIYAYKLKNGFDKKIQRVYKKHLLTKSSYNTYVIQGLPPAPICLPNPSAIDAVLNPESHDYIYFCADPDRPGYHSFTSNYTEHERNAKKYRNWLKRNNIR